MGEIHQTSAVAGIEGDGLEIGGQRFAQPAHLVQVQGEAAIAGRQLRVDLERTVRGLDAAGEGRAVAVRAQKVIGVGDFTVGFRKLRIDRDGTVQQIDSGLQAVFIRLAWGGSGLNEQLIRRDRRCRAFPDARLFFERHAGIERLADLHRDVALRREDVDAFPVVLLGPDHASGLRVDELDVDSHAGALLANGAGNRAADPELLGERGQLTAWILELGHRGTADHAERTEL